MLCLHLLAIAIIWWCLQTGSLDETQWSCSDLELLPDEIPVTLCRSYITLYIFAYLIKTRKKK